MSAAAIERLPVRALGRALLMALVAIVVAMPAVHADPPPSDYSNPDYLAYDLDNMGRTTERQGYHVTTPGYWEASLSTFPSTFLNGQARQQSDLLDGRVYVTLGQLAPGATSGIPRPTTRGCATRWSS